MRTTLGARRPAPQPRAVRGADDLDCGAPGHRVRPLDLPRATVTGSRSSSSRPRRGSAREHAARRRRWSGWHPGASARRRWPRAVVRRGGWCPASRCRGGPGVHRHVVTEAMRAALPKGPRRGSRSSPSPAGPTEQPRAMSSWHASQQHSPTRGCGSRATPWPPSSRSLRRGHGYPCRGDRVDRGGGGRLRHLGARGWRGASAGRRRERFWLGRRGLADALAAADGRGGSDALLALATRRFGDAAAIPECVYGDPSPPAWCRLVRGRRAGGSRVSGPSSRGHRQRGGRAPGAYRGCGPPDGSSAIDRSRSS